MNNLTPYSVVQSLTLDSVIQCLPAADTSWLRVFLVSMTIAANLIYEGGARCIL